MNTTTYTVYRADGRIEVGAIDWPESPPLRDIRALVEPIVGGPLEHVRVLDPARAEADEVSRDDYRDMFVDELGHVRDPSKPYNHAATAIYRANWLRGHGGPEDLLNWIAGDAIVFDRIVWR